MDHLDITDEVENAAGPYHDFYVFRQTERAYSDYWGLLGRKDAPVRLPDDTIGFLWQTLQWTPTLHPDKENCEEQQGLNRWGPTIIAPAGGECFRQICLGWAQILSQGPEPLLLSGGIHGIEMKGENWKPYYFRTPREKLVADLQLLAQFGEQVAAGEYFILHLGV